MRMDQLLAGCNLPPEQQHALKTAFNNVLKQLGLVDRGDPLCEMIARKVIETGKIGYSNAVAITEMVVRQFRE
jgi:hypothetical protein